jgi:hypothetical protein
MHINEEQSFVTFDRLVPADRDFGSSEAIKLAKPAERAVAPNAKGVFAARTLQEIHDGAQSVAAKLRDALTA